MQQERALWDFLPLGLAGSGNALLFLQTSGHLNFMKCSVISKIWLKKSAVLDKNPKLHDSKLCCDTSKSAVQVPA